MCSEDPPTADEQAAEKGKEQKRPHRDNYSPKAVFAQKGKEEKNREHRQRVSRHAFDKSNADQEQPVPGYPSGVNRPEFEPARARADKAEPGKDELLRPDDLSLVWITAKIAERVGYAVPGPGERHVEQLPAHFEKRERIPRDAPVQKQIDGEAGGNDRDPEPLPTPAPAGKPLMSGFDRQCRQQDDPVRTGHPRERAKDSGQPPIFFSGGENRTKG